MELGQQTTTATPTGGGAAIALETTPPLARLDMIDESPFNPRKTFHGLAELGASLRDRWLVPLIVRPHPKITGRYQLVDGARRYRAAKQAGIHSAPVNVVHLSDQEVMIAQHVTYLREELLELERAESYRLLMTEASLSAKEIAKRIGVSVESVYGRLKLLDAIEPVKKALNEVPGFTAGHGVLIARLDAGTQAKALKACLPTSGATNMPSDGEVMSVRELDQWIEWEVRRQKRSAEEAAARKAQPPAKRQASKPATDWEAQRAKEEAARKREQAVRRAILDSALEGVKAPLERADLEFVALSLIDDRRWDDDFADELQTITKMKPQALAHVFIKLAVADELEGGEKPERLLAFAKRHKVNVERVRKRAEEEYAVAEAKKALAAKAQTAAQPKTAKAGAK